MGFSSFLSSTPAPTRTARPVSGFSAFLRVEEASLAPAPQARSGCRSRPPMGVS